MRGQVRNRRSRLFFAMYDGECSHCLSDILEGDEIGYVDDEICCQNCWDDAG